MADLNYISSIVKIIETPILKSINAVSVIECRVQKCKSKRNKSDKDRILNLIVWGKLGEDLLKYYQLNDYIIIEGYLALTKDRTLFLSSRKFIKSKIFVKRIYPYFLSKID